MSRCSEDRILGQFQSNTLPRITGIDANSGSGSSRRSQIIEPLRGMTDAFDAIRMIGVIRVIRGQTIDPV